VPFPRKMLNDGEEVILDLRPHWSVLARSGALVVLALALVGAVAVVNFGGTAGTVALYGTVGLLALALVSFGFRYARWTTTNFTVTTDRLVYRAGVLAKRGREIPLDRLNDISFHQSIFERIIGTGDLMIESAGREGQETFGDIPRPARVQNVIYQEVERFRDRAADRAAGRRDLSIPEQIDQLDDLRQRGVISQAEFDAKKAQLLDRM